MNSFFETSITLMLKPRKNGTKNESNCSPILPLNIDILIQDKRNNSIKVRK